MRIKVNDTVKVLIGDYRDEEGRVLSVDHARQMVVVEGVNKVWKHVRRSQQNPQGGRLSKEMPVRADNVQLKCRHCSATTRVGIRVTDDGSKERFCKKCQKAIDSISPPKASRAGQ